MTPNEKQLLQDIFIKFRALYYRQKVNDDLIERILRKLPPDTVSPESHLRIEESDARITHEELKSIEERINNI